MDIAFCSLLGPFLKNVEHVDRFLKFSHIKHPVGSAFIPGSDFMDASSNCGHRLPIVRFLPLLHFEQLMSRSLPRILR